MKRILILSVLLIQIGCTNVVDPFAPKENPHPIEGIYKSLNINHKLVVALRGSKAFIKVIYDKGDLQIQGRFSASEGTAMPGVNLYKISIDKAFGEDLIFSNGYVSFQKDRYRKVN